MPPERQIREIRIVTDVKGDKDLKAVADRLGAMSRQLKSVSTAADIFNFSFTSLLAGFSIRSIVQMSDSISLLSARINVLAGSTEEGAQALAGIGKVAERTHTSLTDTAQIYARMAATTKELGISTAGLLSLTETLQNSFRLSGAGAQEATSAAIQLSQGFASGQLRGQELRSTLEANVVLGDALAKQFNVTRGGLYKLAEAGKITAKEALLAIFNQSKNINSEAAKLTPTIGQSLTGAFNILQLAVLRLNEEYKINARFADALAAATGKVDLIITAGLLVSLPKLFILLSEITLATAGATAGLTLLVGAGAILVTQFDSLADVGNTFRRMAADILGAVSSFALFNAEVSSFVRYIPPFYLFNKVMNSIGQSTDSASKKLNNLSTEFEKDMEAIKEAQKIAGKEDIFFRQQDLEDTIKKITQINSKVEEANGPLKALNAAYLEGAYSLAEYGQKAEGLELGNLDKKFAQARISVEKYEEGILKLEQINISRLFKAGAISADEFKTKIDSIKIEMLRNQFESGKISALEFNRALLKIKDFNFPLSLQTGIQSFIASIGTVGEQVAKVVENTFNNLGDKIFEFTKTGKVNFEDLTQAILDDIAKIAIRSAIVAPLAKFLGGALGGAFGGTGGTTGVTGGAYDNPTGLGKIGGEVATSFANNYFTGGGNAAASGSGNVDIVINNSSGADIAANETTNAGGSRTIDFLVTNKVKEAMSNGALDKAFSANYNLKRAGV